MFFLFKITSFHRYLATGSSFRTLAFTFRMGVSTVASIVKETVGILWDVLQPLHMPTPTLESFTSTAQDFYEIWDFPHCLGALDGKHIRVKCPANSGSMFFNYKHFFSIVLQGVADAHYKFIYIDVGGYGKQSDGGTFKASDLYRALTERQLQLPPPAALPQSNIVAPYVFIADEAYPLLPFLLKPYSGTNLPVDQDSFNKRLSRSRKSIECAFGILNSKWTLLSKCIDTDVRLADSIVKCICILHNTIIDREGMEHSLTEVTSQSSGMPWQHVGTHGRHSTDAKLVREVFKSYFVNNPLAY